MQIYNIIECLKCYKNQESTKKNYLSIWRHFNRFLGQLDKLLEKWEQRTVLFAGYLIDQGLQSSTIRSYVSAIKCMLVDDNYKWEDDMVILNTLTRACKRINDRVYIRKPIKKPMLELILFELGRYWNKQPYLCTMYRALFALLYYGLFRIGELTLGNHLVHACNVHIAKEKGKMLFILFTSKTHDQASKPQKIKITRLSDRQDSQGHFCPFMLTEQYLQIRGDYADFNEQFFIFSDKSPVKAEMARKVLKDVLKHMNIECAYFGTHGFCAGRACDLLKAGYSVDQIKIIGHWKSNAVYRYLRT